MALTTVQSGLLDSVAQYYSFKNRIINGGMGIWQRGTSFTGITNVPVYGCDRWVGFVSAAVAGEQILQSASVPSGTGFLYSAAFGRTAANTNTNSIWFNQLIESNNMRDLAGQPVTLSFWAKTGANYSGGAMTVRVASGTTADQSINTYSAGPATGYTGYAAVINTTQSLTTTWTQYSFTGTVGATALELAVSFGYTPTGTAGADDNIYITGVQLEKGSTATSFDYRPYGTELALCQRYYWGVNGSQLGGAGETQVGMFTYQGTNTAYVMITNPIQMRTAAGITISGNFQWTQNGTQTGVTNVTGVLSNPYNNMLAINVISGLGVGSTGRLSIAGSASGIVQFSAEL